MTSRRKVKAWEGTITFSLHGYDEDVQPDIFQKLRRWPISYPYPRNDLIHDRGRKRTFRALFLENEYLKVTVLPELGGHLYSAYDKVAGQEVFYRMSELRPKPLGRRGAWGPLGIEFNFPSAHSPTTLSPVDAVLRKNPDGGGSIVIGDIDLVGRMRWSIDITLRPGERAVHAVVTLHNRTGLPRPYYYWANAAIPVDDHTRFVLPITSTRGHGLPGSGSAWPVRGGVDLSWRRNIKHTMGVFGHGCREDFFGAYNVAKDCGVVHVADYRILPGKKVFDWGTGPQGTRKGTEFTEADGAYAEIQAGLFEGQPSYEVLEPHRVVRFSETWLPVHGLGVAFSRANENGAVALDVESGRGVRIGVNVTRPRRRCRIVLRRGGRRIFAVVRDVSPERPFTATVKSASARGDAAGLELSVTCPAQGLLISHRVPGRPAAAKPTAGWLDEKTHPDEPPENHFRTDGNLEKRYLRGLQLLKIGLPRPARTTFEQVLEKDPGYAPAHLQMGMLSVWSGEWRRAVNHLTRALARNPNLVEAHYYLGIALTRMGEHARAKDAFWVALRSQVGDVRCHMQLGLAAMRQGEYEEAVGFFRRVLDLSPLDARAAGMLSASLRRLGRPEEAVTRLTPMLSSFPADRLLCSEMRLAARARRADTAFRKLLGRNVQAYLELASDYDGVGLHTEALDVLKCGIAATRSRGHVYPMLCYYAGFVLEQLGRTREAKRYYRRGGRMKPDLCFPGRYEEITVLQRVLEVFPDDARAAQYLGNILYHRTRREEAVGFWRRAFRRRKDSLVLCTSIGLAAWEEGHARETVRWLRRAGRLVPDDVRLLLWLAHVMGEAGGREHERLQLLQDLFERHPEHDDVREEYASLLLDRGKVEKALTVITEHQFRTRHGIFTLSQMHLNAHTRLGESCLARGNHVRALEHFQQARHVPLELGEDETRFNFYGKVHYLAGVCLEKMGRKREARKCYRRCVTEGRRWLPELHYYDHLSYLGLGRPKAARRSLDRLGEAIERLERMQDVRPAYVHYLRSLHLEGRGRRSEAAKEARLARRAGWRTSQEMHFKFRFGFS